MVGYDVVGIAVSGEYRGARREEQSASMADRAVMDEKWAHRNIELATLSLSSAALREVTASFPGGVAVVGGLLDERPIGATATFFGVVSFDPVLASVGVPRDSAILGRLRELRRLGVSVLAAPQQSIDPSLSLRGEDIFAGMRWRHGPEGSVLLHGANLWLDCEVHSEVAGGDQAILMLEVHGVWIDRTTRPLRWAGPASRSSAAS